MSELRTFTLAEIEERTGFDKRTIAYYVQQGLLPKVGRRGPKTRYPQIFLDRLRFVNLVREKQDLGEVGSLTLSEIRDLMDTMSPESIADVVAGVEPLQMVAHAGLVQRAAASAPAPEPRPAIETAVASPTFAEEIIEISQELLEPENESPVEIRNANRQVRLGLMDANAAKPKGFAHEPIPNGHTVPGASPPALSIDHTEVREDDGSAETDDEAPPSIDVERLGWFLARLQRAMTEDRRRRLGTTESWHRALITPELTISARNLKDKDAHMLDAVARILKKLLWAAWEE
jgi:DNA-binding transcriptional MerR regulator